MMKKDLNWLKKEIATEMIELEPNRKERWSDVRYQTLRNVAQKIYQLDEPEVLSQELPVIPKYVADFIEVRKGTDAYRLKYILCVAVERSEQEEYTKAYDWISANDETFARAWLSGYEVEEEPLYYALIKGHELIDSGFKYWTCHTWNRRGAFVGRKILYSSKYKTVLPISVWDDFGLNDSNADFVKADEESN